MPGPEYGDLVQQFCMAAQELGEEQTVMKISLTAFKKQPSIQNYQVQGNSVIGNLFFKFEYSEIFVEILFHICQEKILSKEFLNYFSCIYFS